MAIAYSKLTARGQTSVPQEVRQKLGLGPGSTLEWTEEDGRIVVRRATRFTSQDLHQALFETPPTPHTLAELKQGVQEHVRSRHARR